MNLSKTQEIIQGLESFCQHIDQLKEQFKDMKEEIIKQINELIQFLNKQTENINEEKEKSEKLSNTQQCNRVCSIFNLFNEKLKKKLQTISKQIWEKISLIQESHEYIRVNQQPYEETMKVSLNLKDDSVKQEEFCLAITFNQSGTIMVSGCDDKIKVWDFNNGNIKEITTLNPDSMQILSLTFSKNNNNFLSGSNAINMWYTTNNKSWQNVYQIDNAAYCMILNSEETKLYTGGDKSISVFNINFQKQIILLVCELNLPSQQVYSLSLNEDETFLAASCSCDDKPIHVWEIKQNTIELYQTIKTNQLGHNLCFINNTQLIWLPAEQYQQNCIQVYDLQNGEFQEQEEKGIHLLQNYTCCDTQFFPIVFNKERNIIVVRHKLTVYLLQVFSNGKHKVINQKQFETNEIYGTITNDGTALVLWDSYNMKYLIFEIEIE